MKASLAQRIDYQVKCDRSIQIGAAKRKIVVKTTTTTARKAAVVTFIWKGAKRCSRTVSLNRSRIQKADPIPKSRTVLLLLTEHLQRNPSNEKGKGRPLPVQGNPLAKLSKLRLSRKKVRKLQAESLWKVCFARFIQSSIYPPWPNP